MLVLTLTTPQPTELTLFCPRNSCYQEWAHFARSQESEGPGDCQPPPAPSHELLGEALPSRVLVSFSEARGQALSYFQNSWQGRAFSTILSPLLL